MNLKTFVLVALIAQPLLAQERDKQYYKDKAERFEAIFTQIIGKFGFDRFVGVKPEDIKELRGRTAVRILHCFDEIAAAKKSGQRIQQLALGIAMRAETGSKEFEDSMRILWELEGDSGAIQKSKLSKEQKREAMALFGKWKKKTEGW